MTAAMILAPEDWMNIRRFRVLHETGSTYAEIARECRVDPRTIKKYLEADAGLAPPRAPSRAGTQPQVITPFAPLIEAWLRGDLSLKASVIYERLVADHGFTGHYQRVKMHLASVRPLIEDELFATDDNNLSRAGFDGDHQATEDEEWRHHGSTPVSFGSERSG